MFKKRALIKMFSKKIEEATMKKTIFILLAFPLIVCFTSFTFIETALAKENTMKWRMTLWSPRLPAYEPLYDQFTKEVEKASGGRLIIEDVYSGEGVPGSQVLEAVESGLVEMGVIVTVYHAGKFPAGLVEWGLPGVPSSLEAYWTLFEETKWKEVLGKSYEAQNVKWIGSHPTHGTYMLTKKPIKSLADLKGMKLRAFGAYAKFARKLGAVTVSTSFAEAYTSLATGVVDGIFGNPILDLYDGKFYELAKHLCPVQISGYITNPFIVNLDAWNKLPPDIQEILTLAAGKFALTYRANLRLELQKSLDDMKKSGVQMGPEFSDADQAIWKKASREVWSEYSKDEYSKELIEIQNEFIDTMDF
jgi:TRAP-type C4-dicarboxylate transport system substrate-binding protein